MIMRHRPEKDTVNPPGQIRYLRDVIRKYQEEDKAQEPRSVAQATIPSTQPENGAWGQIEVLRGQVARYRGYYEQSRAERAKMEKALLMICDQADKRQPGGWWPKEIRKIIAENT